MLYCSHMNIYDGHIYPPQKPLLEYQDSARFRFRGNAWQQTMHMINTKIQRAIFILKVITGINIVTLSLIWATQ